MDIRRSLLRIHCSEGATQFHFFKFILSGDACSLEELRRHQEQYGLSRFHHARSSVPHRVSVLLCLILYTETTEWREPMNAEETDVKGTRRVERVRRPIDPKWLFYLSKPGLSMPVRIALIDFRLRERHASHRRRTRYHSSVDWSRDVGAASEASVACQLIIQRSASCTRAAGSSICCWSSSLILPAVGWGIAGVAWSLHPRRIRISSSLTYLRQPLEPSVFPLRKTQSSGFRKDQSTLFSISATLPWSIVSRYSFAKLLFRELNHSTSVSTCVHFASPSISDCLELSYCFSSNEFLRRNVNKGLKSRASLRLRSEILMFLLWRACIYW